MQILVLGCLALLMTGCDAFVDLKVIPREFPVSDMSWPAADAVDLAYSGCRAAVGLAGVPLMDNSGNPLCIDFNNPAVSTQTLTDSGWNLAASAQGCSGFYVDHGYLSINMPISYPHGDCQARLPSLTIPPGTKKIVLSIIQTLAIFKSTQSGQIEEVSTGQRYWWSAFSGQGVPVATTLEFSAASSRFITLLRAENTDSNPALLPIWQIQSIAVLGTQ